MKKSGIISAAIMLFAAGSLCARVLTLGGSDILRSVVEDGVAQSAKRAGLEVKFDMRGTYLAMPALEKDQCDAAVIALPRGKSLPEGYVGIPFAYQIAVVAVNAVNPIEEITTKQLFDIYSTNASPRVEMWSQLGVPDASLRNIVAITTSFSDNLVVELFKTEALSSSNLGDWVNMVQKKSDIPNIVQTNNSVVAVMGRASSSNLMKILPVSRTSAGRAYAFKPDIENIFNGDYPLTLPFYVVFKKSNVKNAKALVRILLDDDMAKRLEKADFYAVPKNSRKNSIFELDISR